MDNIKEKLVELLFSVDRVADVYTAADYFISFTHWMPLPEPPKGE